MVNKSINRIWVGHRPYFVNNDLWNNYKLAGWVINEIWNESHLINIFSKIGKYRLCVNLINKILKSDYNDKYQAAADIYRILVIDYTGGVYLDIDFEPTELVFNDAFLMDDFAFYENEMNRSGLVSNAFLGSSKNSKFTNSMIEYFSLLTLDQVVSDEAWITTGPVVITKVFRKYHLFDEVNVFPSRLIVNSCYCTDLRKSIYFNYIGDLEYPKNHCDNFTFGSNSKYLDLDKKVSLTNENK